MILDSSPNSFASGYRPLLYNFTSEQVDLTIFNISSLIKADSLAFFNTISDADANDVAVIPGVSPFFITVGDFVKILSGIYEGVHAIKWKVGGIFGLDIPFESVDSNVTGQRFRENHFDGA